MSQSCELKRKRREAALQPEEIVCEVRYFS